jgi:hypothetical protein
MEIPLVLRRKKDGSFSYAMPLAFRVAMIAILGLVLAASFSDGGTPGAIGWILIALAAFASLYDERWSFDAQSGVLTHRLGLWPVRRRVAVAKGEIARFKIEPFVRGTVPGTADEAAEKAAALAGGRADDSGKRRALYKKPYLCLVCEAADGSRYFMNAVVARKGDKIKTQAALMAQACGVELVEG